MLPVAYRHRFSLFIVALASLGIRCDVNPANDSAACNVYLTWQGDTSTTITVNFHTLTGEAGDPIVFYDTADHGLDLDAYAFSSQGTSIRMPPGSDERFVHSVELTKLLPGQTYFFVGILDGFAGENLEIFSTGVRSFRTIPSSGEAIRFISGGDMDTHLATWDLMRRARDVDPMFAAIGGDIAYADGNLRNFGKWDAWLRMWEEIMVTDDGHMIPMVLAIGNHEVDGGYGGRLDDAPFFINYFPQAPERTYFARTFGTDLVLYVLDSGHVAPHGGAQAVWLRSAMEENSGFTHQLAIYHVPLYPSHRGFLGINSILGRAMWGPIFDEFHLDTAFENHDHTLKRSKRLRGGQVDPGGTLYLGDGCFGQFTRDINEDNLAYLDFAASVRHFWFIEVNGSRATYTAIDRDGETIDSVTVSQPGVAENVPGDLKN